MPRSAFQGNAVATWTMRRDDKLDRNLKQLTKKEHRTNSEVAREVLRRHLMARRVDELSLQLRPSAEAAGRTSDGDFFREIS